MPRNNNDKIMDMLAKVLQCYSNCVAIANIETQFVIAANEFTENTSWQNSQYLLIKEVMNYFKSIAETGVLNDGMRDNLMFHIHQARSRAKGLEIYGDNRKFIIADDAAVRKFINSSRMKTMHERVPSRKECKGFKSQGNLRIKIAATYTDMWDIYKCITTIESSILRGRSKDWYNYAQDEYKITSAQLIAFKNFDDSYHSENILFNELPKQAGSAHAEMQILAYLINQKVNKPIYIGISKRCCFNCDCMITAANEVLESYKYKLRINTDNPHMGAFPDTWVIPNAFSHGKNEYIKNLFSKIENRYREIYETNNPSFNYNMEHSEKSTPRSDGDDANNYFKAQTKTKEVLEKFVHSPISDLTVKDNLKIVDYSIMLFHSGIISTLFELPVNDGLLLKEIAGGFYSNIIRLIEQGLLPEKGNKELLLSFLKTRVHFPDVEQKEKIIEILLSKFNIFAEKIQLEENKKQESTTSTNTKITITPDLVSSTILNSTVEISQETLVETSRNQTEKTSNLAPINQMHIPLVMPHEEEIKPKSRPKARRVPKNIGSL